MNCRYCGRIRLNQMLNAASDKLHCAQSIDRSVQYINSNNRVYGIIYDLRGNTATAVQFFVTDSSSNFLRGSLYFDTEPDADSLAPVVDFFREDIIHLIESLKWEKM